MAYLKRGPWATGDQIDDLDLIAMDDAIAAAQHTAHLDLGNVSGTVIIDAATYGSVSLRLTGNATLVTSGMSPSDAVGHLDVFINRDGHAVTWPTGTVWPGTAPTLTGAPDLVRLIGQGSTVFARHITQYRFNEGALPAIGSVFMGGFYAGIMDTIATAPDARDLSQRRIRYALIVSPRSMQTTGLYYLSSLNTVWDGQAITPPSPIDTMTFPRDGASAWYLPSQMEAQLLFWLFKPATRTNQVTAGLYNPYETGTATFAYGAVPYADPTKPAVASGSPAQTALTAFRSGGAQYIGGLETDTNGSNIVGTSSWGTFSPGYHTGIYFADVTRTSTAAQFSQSQAAALRPVRRLILAEAA